MFGIDDLVSGGIGVIGGAFDMWRQRKLQEEQWGREDTAIQRRVADYKAAGLSPVLAAGGSGASSTVLAQKGASDVQEGVLKALATRKAQADIGISEAERRIREVEAKKAEIDLMDFQSFDPKNNFGMQNGDVPVTMPLMFQKMNAQMEMLYYQRDKAKSDSEKAAIEKEIAQKKNAFQGIINAITGKELNWWEVNNAFKMGLSIIGGVSDLTRAFKPVRNMFMRIGGR